MHAAREQLFHRITEVLRCKWTLAILDAMDRGVNRPGRLQKELPGLTPKVLNERLRKLQRYGWLERHAYPEIPPRVEYTFTEQGRHMLRLVRLVGTAVDEWLETDAQSRTS